MNYEITESTENDKEALAELRVLAMRESLEAIGRFDPQRARSRFIDSYRSEDTKIIITQGEVAGFYTLSRKDDHLYIDHFYIQPYLQGNGIGGRIIASIKHQATSSNYGATSQAWRS